MIATHILNFSMLNVQILKGTETEHHSKVCLVKGSVTQGNLYCSCY